MRQRLINCDFLDTEAFNDKISNKAKLLYYQMFINGDDRGFVGNTNTIIETLKKNDDNFVDVVNMSLLENDYPNALYELINKGYLYEFRDNHENKVHLIRHWFVHNKYRKGLWTNYGSFLKQVQLDESGKYVLKETHLKENKLNESNVNEIKLNELEQNNNEENEELDNEDNVEEENTYTFEDFLRDKGVSSFNELTKEQIEEWKDICINGIKGD